MTWSGSRFRQEHSPPIKIKQKTHANTPASGRKPVVHVLGACEQKRNYPTTTPDSDWLYPLPPRTTQLFSNADTSDTESTRATGAAGVLLLLSILYCLGYPVVRAFRRAKSGREGPEGQEEWRTSAAAVAAGDYAT